MHIAQIVSNILIRLGRYHTIIRASLFSKTKHTQCETKAVRERNKGLQSSLTQFENLQTLLSLHLLLIFHRLQILDLNLSRSIKLLLINSMIVKNWSYMAHCLLSCPTSYSVDQHFRHQLREMNIQSFLLKSRKCARFRVQGFRELPPSIQPIDH